MAATIVYSPVDGLPVFVAFTVEGEAASKANSRRLVQGRSIKSAKALKFFHTAALQVPNLSPPFDCEVAVTMFMFYADKRPDMDEAVLLDAMQSTFVFEGKGKDRKKRVIRSAIYDNDRLVRERHVFHAIDAERPRIEVEVQRRELSCP